MVEVDSGQLDQGKLEAAWHQWWEPFEAVAALLSAGMEDREHAVNWLAARLRSGELRVIGLDYDFDDAGGLQRTRYAAYRSSAWRNVHQIPWKHDFWVSGVFREDRDDDARAIFPIGAYIERCRFNPAPILAFCDRAGLNAPLRMENAPATATPLQQPDQPAQHLEEMPPEPRLATPKPYPLSTSGSSSPLAQPEAKKDLPTAEAERFATALMAGWPTCSEAFAHTKAELFFPEHRVPRDWFLRIFRAIRGPKKRGKVPKTRP